MCLNDLYSVYVHREFIVCFFVLVLFIHVHLLFVLHKNVQSNRYQVLQVTSNQIECMV